MSLIDSTLLSTQICIPSTEDVNIKEHFCNAVGDVIKIESASNEFEVYSVSIYATCAPGFQVNDFNV